MHGLHRRSLFVKSLTWDNTDTWENFMSLQNKLICGAAVDLAVYNVSILDIKISNFKL